MTTLSTIALSGMNAAQTSLNASAHNIANANTPGFQRQQVVQSAQTPGSVTTRLATAATEGSALATDMLTQLHAKNAMLANLAVFKTSTQLSGTLFNLQA